MKKNGYQLVALFKELWQSKVLKVMRLVLFALLFSATQMLAVDTYSQNTPLTLDLKNTSIKNILGFIQDNSEFYFIYDASLVDVQKEITIKVKNKLIPEVLDEIFRGSNVVYRITDRQIALTALNYSASSIQQNKTVSGKVTDMGSQPLPGVTVVLKGTTQGTITTADGDYSLSNVPENATLVFSFVGMKAQEVVVGNRVRIDIKMEEETIGLEEVVAVGYGTVKKVDLTGSVEKVNTDIYKNQSMTQLTDMLNGTVAGFNTIQGTSAKGGSSIEIRGANSLNASTEPMVVLDGAIYNGSISDINPVDVESIDILKDASSAAVFGARAASGVILITTSKGKTGKPTINFSSQVGIAKPTNDFRPNDKDKYITWRQDVMRQRNPNKPLWYYNNPSNLPDGVSLEQWRNESANPNEDNAREWLSRLTFYPVEVENYLNGNSVDWYSKVIGTGVRQKYDLSVGGGTENLSYYWSFDYQNNEGIIKGDDFSTFRTRLNFDFDINDWLNVGINSQFADRDESTVTANMYQMYIMSPYGSMYEEDGSLKWYPNDFAVLNPFMNYYGQDRLRKINSLFANMYANISFPLGINYKISFQPRYEFFKDYNFYSTETITGGAGGSASRVEYFSFNWILDHIVSWKKELGMHSFDLTLLYSAEQNKYWESTLGNEIFVPNEKLGFGGLQFGTNPSVESLDAESTGDAAMARINYILNNKYLLTASIRRDGYSAFGKENPRAYFPAVALGWKISEEDFFDIEDVYQLKLRASWGTNGNREIGSYAALAQLNSTLYYNGSNVQVGVFNESLANYGLVWEKTESLNFGFDLGLYNNRLTLTGDFYKMNTKDLLMDRLLPEITGYESVTSNLGELENKGFELTLNSVNIKNEQFSWQTNLVFSLNRNKIVRLFGDYEEVEIDGKVVKREVPDYSNEWFPGHAIDHIWNYKIQGVWQLGEEEAAAVYGLRPGDWKAEDVDDNDKYEAIQDKQFIGYKEPRYRVGMRNDFGFLKNWTASFFVRADIGHMGRFTDALRRGGNDTYDRRNYADYPYWSAENPTNEWGRLTLNENVFGGGLMIYKPRTFVRLQDLSVAYSIPRNIINRYNMDNMSVYFSAHNLFYFSKWPGWDPESLSKSNGSQTPMPKTFTLGLRLTL